MLNYRYLKKKYDILVREELKRNNEILKESFIEYFGEDKRNLIEKRFSEFVYFYYINWDTISLVIDRVKDEYIDKYREYFEFADVRDDNTFTKLKKGCYIDNFIGTTDKSILDFFSKSKKALEKIKGVNPFNFLLFDRDKTKRVICFNLFLTDEISFIHELNHALTSSWLAKLILDNEENLLIEKMGLNVWNNEEALDETLEELITEKTSIKIYEIFKRRGGYLSSFLQGGIYESVYRFNLYLIDEFFDSFEDSIKKARIEENKNALIELVGKVTYEYFCMLINVFYTKDEASSLKKKENAFSSICPIVKYMCEYAKEQEKKEEDLDNYYEYLRSMGKKVTILNKK